MSEAKGHMVTANRLRDGAVVFLASGRRWTTRVGEGHVAETEAHATQLLQTAEAMPTEVVGPYLIEVAAEDGGWSPTRYRERIRAHGPSVDTPANPPAGGQSAEGQPAKGV
jgi:sulfite reductase (NADPH) hemoprotein beta-component